MPDITLKDLVQNNLNINSTNIQNYAIYSDEELLSNLLEWICSIFQVEINDEKSLNLMISCIDIYKTILVQGVTYSFREGGIIAFSLEVYEFIWIFFIYISKFTNFYYKIPP